MTIVIPSWIVWAFGGLCLIPIIFVAWWWISIYGATKGWWKYEK